MWRGIRHGSICIVDDATACALRNAFFIGKRRHLVPWLRPRRQRCPTCYAAGMPMIDDTKPSPAPTKGDELAPCEPDAEPNLGWTAENMAALQSSNCFVERHGLPLAQYRNF